MNLENHLINKFLNTTARPINSSAFYDTTNPLDSLKSYFIESS